jgi:hypothetical protein
MIPYRGAAREMGIALLAQSIYKHRAMRYTL